MKKIKWQQTYITIYYFSNLNQNKERNRKLEKIFICERQVHSVVNKFVIGGENCEWNDAGRL